MIVHELFAQVFDGEVKNIMVCENYPTADHLTKCIYGSEAYAVDCLQYKAQIGDKYHDGFFWYTDEETGEETKREYVPTLEQQVTAQETQLSEMTDYQAEMLYELSLMQLGITE